MKGPLLVVTLAGASLALASGALWLLREARSSAPVAQPADGSSGRPSSEALPSLSRAPVGASGPVRDRVAVALDPVAADAEAPPVLAQGPSPWPLREPPVVDGPRIESHYASGQPEFVGTQVRDADGRWVRDGPWTAWYESGQLCEVGAYREGLEHGPWDWYYEDGTRMASGSWVDGKRVGEWTFWHEGGELGSVGSYVDGVGAGVWTLYHENGLKWAEGPWSNGEPNGFWRVWHPDGTVDLEGTGTYVDGVQVD